MCGYCAFAMFCRLSDRFRDLRDRLLAFNWNLDICSMGILNVSFDWVSEQLFCSFCLTFSCSSSSFGPSSFGIVLVF